MSNTNFVTFELVLFDLGNGLLIFLNEIPKWLKPISKVHISYEAQLISHFLCKR